MTRGGSERSGIEWLLVTVVTGSDGALRVRVWRELRKLGAVYLHNAVCLLPNRPSVAGPVGALVEKVRAGDGTARVLRTRLLDPVDEATVVAEQVADRDREFADVVERSGEFLAEVERETSRQRATYTEVEELETDLERFDRWMRRIDARDHFGAPGRAAAVTALQRCRDVLAEFQETALAADTGSGPAPASEGPLRIVRGET